MAIRMEKDQPDRTPKRERTRPQPDDQTQRQQRSRFPLWYLALALFTILKKPKWLIPIVVILGIFFLLRSFYWQYEDQIGQFTYEAQDDQYSFGAQLNETEYDKALVYEPLSLNNRTGLPSQVSLEQFSPTPLHQGRQGSCSGWACAYGARTISFARATGQNPNSVAFSPSFLYNQIARPGCQGAFLRDAMEAMRRIGSVPFSDFGYTDQTCQISPDLSLRGAATQYRIKGYTRLSRGPGDYATNSSSVKQHLAQGAPVIIGMMVGSSFQHQMMGEALWRPSRADYAGVGLGGHAMCVVGYDDDVAGGAFRVLNSWGRDWGDDGFVWITYDDFDHFTKEAFGIYPEAEARSANRERFAVDFSLIDNATQAPIPLQQVDEIVFRSRSALRKGSKFKIMINNQVECYTYILGAETTGETYVLYPYTAKHSPYFGITGRRLFPRDYSLTLDQVGNRDYMAVIFSKEPLNYEDIQGGMNRSRQPSFMLRMVEQLVNDFVPECSFQDGNAISFDCRTGGKNALGVIIELDKR